MAARSDRGLPGGAPERPGSAATGASTDAGAGNGKGAASSGRIVTTSGAAVGSACRARETVAA
ncbi:MAG: hypothetical protein WBP56_19665 [Polyangia bacterium]